MTPLFLLLINTGEVEELYQQTKPIEYNVNSSEENVFTKSELFSIIFQDIVDTYSIPREATREIVRLFKSMLDDNLKSNMISSSKYHPTCLL